MVVVGVGSWLGYSKFTNGPGRSGISGGNLIHEATPADILSQIKHENAPVTLVNFWASWCQPCKLEMPYILEARSRYAQKGLKVIFISIDNPEDLPAAEAFLRDQKVDFESFYKGNQSLSFVNEIFPKWQGAVPATILFRGDLIVLDSWEGEASLEDFVQRLDRAYRLL